MGNGIVPQTIGQVGANLMKYWPALLGGIFLISSVVGAQYQLAQHAKAIEKIEEALLLNTNESAQWDMLMGLGQDARGMDTRLKEVEEHITPESIQTWGAVQARVTQTHEDLRDHIRNHGR